AGAAGAAARSVAQDREARQARELLKQSAVMDSLANGKDIDRWTATNEATAGVTTTVAAARPEQYGRVPK
ncbi:hypothetical protein OR16_42869, partial [Cupriavidus basilensis OR16]